MRVTALRACTAIGARATARAGGRRARGTGVGMMRHGAVREGASPSGGAVDGAPDGASSGARGAHDGWMVQRFLLINTRFASPVSGAFCRFDT